MVKVAVVGATGYAGVELVRLLLRHPHVQLVAVTSENYAGKPLNQVFPSLGRRAGLVCEPLDPAGLADRADVVFTAAPHGVPSEVAPAVLARGKKLIDIGSDFRLKDPAAYAKWYKREPTPPELVRQAVYGLPELHREEIRNAALVANPGCYPTATILAAAPLLKAGLVDPDSLIADAKSGVSGAGRGVSLGVHFSEVNENFKAYKVAGAHQHTPEIEQELSRVAGRPVVLSFTPHLVPMTRGILITLYASLASEATTEDVLAVYREAYEGEPFVQVCAPGEVPETKQTYGSNHVRIGAAVDPRTNRVTVMSVEDNLVKGAGGQAIQNMNLVFGLPEDAGLDLPGLYP